MKKCFIGREKELQQMQNALDESDCRCITIRGRRGVGKTKLVMEFCTGLNTVGFLGKTGNKQINLDMMIETLEFYGYGDDLVDLESLFTSLGKIARKQQTVFVFDRFQEFCKDNPGFISYTKNFVENDLSGTDSFLIICTSPDPNVPLFDINEKDTVFGNIIELEPISYRECRKMKPYMSDEDFMALYCTIGGVPLYYGKFRDECFVDCVQNSLFSFGSGFLTETDYFLKHVKHSPKAYDILECIASGITGFKELSETIGIPRSACTKLVAKLEYMGIVSRRRPMLGTDRRSKVLEISDPLMDWYFSIVYPHEGIIKTLDSDTVYQRLEPQIMVFLGKAFKSVCTQFIRENYICRDIGSWWGRINDTDTDIDIVAEIIEDGTNKVLVGVCDYGKGKTYSDVLIDLMERSSVLKTEETKVYAIFSRSGFTDDLIKAAEVYGARLVTLKDFL